MGLIRDSFVIFKNWSDAINALPQKNQLETYKALMKFAESGEIPEGLSPIANAMIISFSVGMEKSICRYKASVENGKLGGRPPKNTTEEPKEEEKPIETLEKPITEEPKEEKLTEILENKNLEKPSITQSKIEKPSTNLNVNDNVNDNVDKLVKNIFNNYESAGACECVPIKSLEERQEYLDEYEEFFDYCFTDNFKQVAYEVIDTIIEAREQSKSESGLKFKTKKYTFDKFTEKIKKINCNKFCEIVNQIVFNENIEHKPLYILGCLLA